MQHSQISTNLLREIKDQNKFFDRIVSLFPFGYVSRNRGNAENMENSLVTRGHLPGQRELLHTEKHSPPIVSYSQIEQLKEKLRIKVEAIRSKRCESIGEEGRKSISKRAARRVEKLRHVGHAKKESRVLISNKNIYLLSDKNKSRRKESLENFDIMSVKVTSEHSIGEVGTDIGKDLAGVDYGAITGLKHIPLNKNNKSLTNLRKNISLEKLLADAEAKRQRLSELQSSDQVENKDEALRIQWKDMLQTASGVGEKHLNVAQLKKKLRIKDSLKARSEKAWKSRKSTLISKAKRNIRTHKVHGIRKMNDGREDICKKSSGRNQTDSTSVSVTSKKERLTESKFGNHSRNNRAGFEGRRHEFLNKKGVMSKIMRNPHTV